MADLKLGNKTSVFQDPLEDQSKAEDLQSFIQWEGNNGDSPITDDVTQANRGGWPVEEMFKKNQSLGVQSTFKDDLTQYTTVPAEGSKEDRARAARIAKEIEANEKSKRMAYLENDDEERDLDKETVIPSSTNTLPVENPVLNAQPSESLVTSDEVHTNPVTEVAESETSSEQSAAEKSKFHFNPEAPSFVPRMMPQGLPTLYQQLPQHYIAAQPYSQQGYVPAHIPQSITNTLPPGYILTTQGVGMQPTFIPQPISYVPAGVPIYNHQQIVTSSTQGPPGGGYYQPQTFVVRSNYDMTNGGGGTGGYSIQTNPQHQHHHLPQLQYTTMPLQQQQYHAPQQFQPQQQPLQHQQQQFQPQLPYSQPPPNGLRRYNGQN